MSDRILPVIDDLNRPFWDGCRDEVLRVQECSRCGKPRYPISPVCPNCMEVRWTWRSLSGVGSVYTFAVFRHVYKESWRERVPYAVAIVALVEGVMMIGDVTGVEPEHVKVGLRVRVDFERVTDRIVIPHFVPAET